LPPNDHVRDRCLIQCAGHPLQYRIEHC
jgi:hypothetical protein